MKQLFLFCTLFLLFSCNESGTDKKAGKPDTTGKSGPVQEPAPVVPADPDPEPMPAPVPEPTVALVNSCTRMIFFQPGAEVFAVSYDPEGKINSRQHTRIKSVEEKGGVAIAKVEGNNTDAGENGKETAVSYEYRCDGKNIYFDIASMFRSKEKQKDASFTSTMISFPINVKAGQTLPDAEGQMTSQKGERKMTMKYTFKDRKVEAMEEVTTTAGTWKCFKISNSVHIELDMPGMDEKAKAMMQQMQALTKTTSSTWFAPDFGIVKMEMYLNGKMMSRNEVVGFKR
jgi:hypothetical protein